jgi:hypothetical protein
VCILKDNFLLFSIFLRRPFVICFLFLDEEEGAGGGGSLRKLKRIDAAAAADKRMAAAAADGDADDEEHLGLQEIGESDQAPSCVCFVFAPLTSNL